MFGAVEPVWRMVIRHVTVIAAVYAATRGRFDVAAGLAAFWVALTAWASYSSSERLEAGWVSLLWSGGRKSAKPVPVPVPVRAPVRRPSLA